MANVGWSLCEIPYRSWSLEFSPEPARRTRITTWIATATLIGGVLFYVVGPAGKALGLRFMQNSAAARQTRVIERGMGRHRRRTAMMEGCHGFRRV